MPLTLRPAADADLPFLRELFASTRPEFGLLPEPMRTALLDAQFEGRRGAYAAAHPNGRDQIVEEDGRPVGRLLLDDAVAARTLVDIALVPDVRGRGLGEAILRRVIEESPAPTVKLSVAHGSPAARLYRRLGFVETGGGGVYSAMECAAAPGPPQTSPIRVPVRDTVSAPGSGSGGIPGETPERL